MRIVARVLQHQFVELAGFEQEFVGHEGVLARLAEFDRNHDGFWPARLPAAWAAVAAAQSAARTGILIHSNQATCGRDAETQTLKKIALLE